MSWEIVLGIITLVGFVGTFVGGAWRISNTLATLNTTIHTLRETLDEFRKDNKSSHNDLYNKIEDHEKRITTLEVIQK